MIYILSFISVLLTDLSGNSQLPVHLNVVTKNAQVDSVRPKAPNDMLWQMQHRWVSFFQVLANPDAFEGKRISLQGYMHTKFEDNALYFSKDCADRLMDDESVWVNWKAEWKTDSSYVAVVKEPLDCRWVDLTGIFRAGQHGHMGMFAATLDSVDYAFELKRWYDGAQDLDTTYHR